MYVEAAPVLHLSELSGHEVARLLAADIWPVVRDINQRYLHWDEIRRRRFPAGITAQGVWALAQQTRRLQSKSLLLPEAQGQRFTYTVTDATWANLHQLDMEMGGTVRSPQLLPDGEQRQYLLLGSLMEEAIASSQVEGASTTRARAKKMLRQNRRPRNKSEQMIYNNYVTIKFLRARATEPLTPSLLLAIQAQLTVGTLEDETAAGRLRTSADDVVVEDRLSGEVVHTPPPAPTVAAWVASICALANDTLPLPDTGFLHPVVRASILHFLIGYVHPFVDGNGRTARALFYWCLLRHRYWMAEYLSISRTIQAAPAQYARAYLYTERDQLDLTYFINYQVESLTKAVQELQRYLQAHVAERRQLTAVRQGANLTERHLLLVQELLRDPDATLTVADVQHRFGVAYATARADLLHLASLGLLTAGKAGKQKLLFFRALDFDAVLAHLRAPIG